MNSLPREGYMFEERRIVSRRIKPWTLEVDQSSFKLNFFYTFPPDFMLISLWWDATYKEKTPPYISYNAHERTRARQGNTRWEEKIRNSSYANSKIKMVFSISHQLKIKLTHTTASCCATPTLVWTCAASKETLAPGGVRALTIWHLNANGTDHAVDKSANLFIETDEPLYGNRRLT